jgi:hypothetical protein
MYCLYKEGLHTSVRDSSKAFTLKRGASVLLRIYNFTDGAADIDARMYKTLTTEHEVTDFSKGCALSC